MMTGHIWPALKEREYFALETEKTDIWKEEWAMWPQGRSCSCRLGRWEGVGGG